MIPALNSSQNTTLSLTCSTTENERDARIQLCLKHVLEIAKELGKEDKQHSWIVLCTKLFADSSQELTAEHVHTFILALAQDSEEGTFYKLCNELGTKKWCQEGFQAFLQLSAGTPQRGFRDIQEVAAVLYNDPFLLVTCLVPGFIKGLIPSGALDKQELDMFTEALKYLRPSWDRFAAQTVHNQSFDPLVQSAIQSILSTMSKTSFLHESLAPFIHFFSTVVSCGKITGELKQTLTGQKMNFLAAEVEKAQKFCAAFGSNSTQNAKELKKDGKLSQIQEFLLLDLPTLISVLYKLKTVANVNDFEIGGFEVGNRLVRYGATAVFKAGAFIGNIYSAVADVSASDQIASKLKEDDPHSSFIQFLVRFLNSLGVDEKEQISGAIEKEMMPFLLTLGTELLKKHKLELYLAHLVELNEIIMQPVKSEKQDNEVVTAFASIFLHLLKEVESHYTPAFESLCEAFWQIGKQDPVVQWTDRPISNFVEQTLEEKAVPEVVKTLDAKNAETQIKQNIDNMTHHLMKFMLYKEYFKNPNLGRAKIFMAAQMLKQNITRDKELNTALFNLLRFWRGDCFHVWPLSYLEKMMSPFSDEDVGRRFNKLKNVLEKSINTVLLEYRSYETQHGKDFLEEDRLSSVLIRCFEQREKTLQRLEARIIDNILQMQVSYIDRSGVTTPQVLTEDEEDDRMRIPFDSFS